MREFHLFAGVGGGILGGILLGHRCVGAVEVSPYCQFVLRSRQSDRCLPPFPIYGDIHSFDGTPWRGMVDVVAGGFPCQPWSPAGKRLGIEDPRHLWPQMARVISEIQPSYVFAENNSIDAFEQPHRDLLGMGYTVPPAVSTTAAEIGFPYQRRRWWLLAAHPDRVREPVRPEHAAVEGAPAAGDTHCSRLAKWEGQRSDARPQQQTPKRTAWRVPTSRLRRLLPGPSARLESRKERITAAGNAQVPAMAADAFRFLMEEHFANSN